MNASEEIQKGVDRLNSQPGSPHPFLPETMDTSTYDPNAPLSYVVIFDVINSDNGSSQIMLFSYGKHLGTTTKVPQPLWVEVERLSDSSIKVTYLDEALVWDGVRQGPDFVSTYTWDGKKVVMKGEVPYE